MPFCLGGPNRSSALRTPRHLLTFGLIWPRVRADATIANNSTRYPYDGTLCGLGLEKVLELLSDPRLSLDERNAREESDPQGLEQERSLK